MNMHLKMNIKKNKYYTISNEFDKSENNSNEMNISLIEMEKYIKLRKETFNIIDMMIILEFIFVYRYSNNI